MGLILAVSASAVSARPADCYFSVGGIDYINSRCDFQNVFGDGSFVITSPDGAFVAQIEMNGDGTAQGWWNADAYATGLDGYLGLLYRSDACWVNDYASVCAW